MWAVAKALQIPLDSKIKDLTKLPYTISFVIRKRIQLDSFNELPKEKQPPEHMVWYGTPEELNDWIERVVIKNEPAMTTLIISDEDIER